MTGEAWNERLTRSSRFIRVFRYILSISVLDHSGQMWLTGFNDIGELLLGINANELHQMFVSYSFPPFPLPSFPYLAR